MGNPLSNKPTFNQTAPQTNIYSVRSKPVASPNPQPQIPNVNPANIQQAKDIMEMLKQAKNPDEFIYMYASQNPQLKTIMDVCRGQSPEQVFRDACAQRGINPDDIIKAITM